MESDPVSLTVARTLPRRDVVVVVEEVRAGVEARVTAFEFAISSSPSMKNISKKKEKNKSLTQDKFPSVVILKRKV